MSDELNITGEDGLNGENIITMTDENGNDVQMEVLDIVEYKGEQYIVLLPGDEEEEGEEGTQVLIMRLEEGDEDSDTDSFVGVEDEETLQAVFKLFVDSFNDRLSGM